MQGMPMRGNASSKLTAQKEPFCNTQTLWITSIAFTFAKNMKDVTGSPTVPQRNCVLHIQLAQSGKLHPNVQIVSAVKNLVMQNVGLEELAKEMSSKRFKSRLVLIPNVLVFGFWEIHHIVLINSSIVCRIRFTMFWPLHSLLFRLYFVRYWLVIVFILHK